MPLSIRIPVLLYATFFLFGCGPASAGEPVEGANFEVAGKTSRAIQKYTGLTWFVERILSATGVLAAKGTIGGHTECKIRTWSFIDALKGKFKSVTVTIKGGSYRGIPLPELKFTNITPLHISKKGKVLTPVMVSVTGKADEKEISEALRSKEVSSQLNFLRLDLPGLGDQHLQVINPTVKLEDGQVHITTDLITAGAPPETGISIDIKARPTLKEERFIVLEDTKVDSKDIVEPEQFSRFAEDLLNPLVDFGRMDRKTRAFRMTELKTGNHQLDFKGKLLLAPEPKPSGTEKTRKKKKS